MFGDCDITHMLIGWVIKLQHFAYTGGSYPCLFFSAREGYSAILASGAAYFKHSQCFDLG